MIPHALVRNTVIPFLIILYFTVKHEAPYKLMHRATTGLTITYLGFTLLGLNPITWILNPTWRTATSVIQYLIYIQATTYMVHRNTDSYREAYTLAIMGAASTGYLYEVPMWLNRGITHLFRTSANSFLILDFGMVAVMFLAYLLRDTKPNRKTWVAFAFYLLYVTLGHHFPYGRLYQLLGIQSAITRRTPAMILTYLLCQSKLETR